MTLEVLHVRRGKERYSEILFGISFVQVHFLEYCGVSRV
jgi:hypothetical protein